VQADTWLLADTMSELGCAAQARVLDLCTGTGALAVAAAQAGAAEVTAVDLSYRSSANAWLNVRRHGVPATIRRGDLFGALSGGAQFDLILANPPYVPSFSSRPSRHRVDRCWDAGADGRLLIDRICLGAFDRLAPGGSLLLVQSDVADADRTLRALRDSGFDAEVVRRVAEVFGPVMRARAAAMEDNGLIEQGQVTEQLVVIHATRSLDSPVVELEVSA
jgi:release factor glutamine methyltransferase